MSVAFSSHLAQRYRNELSLLVAILVVIGFTAMIDDSYRLKPGYNAREILRQTSLLGIFALGAATVIIAGGIDLSSGSVIAISATVCASIVFALSPQDANGVPLTSDAGGGILAIAIAGTLLFAFLIGSFHAWLITAINLPPFVATLASLVGLRSLARVLVQEVTGAVSSQGSTTKIYVYDETFLALGGEWWIPLVVFLTLCAVLWLLLAKTVTGRHLYAMGGNEEAARLSGIRTDRLKWLAYCIGTMTAAIAGILYSSEVGSADPTMLARGYELNAIAAAVVGGCSLTGGIGTVPGTMLGALFLRAVIDSVAKTVKQGADDFEGLIVGILVVLAVAFNELRTATGHRKQFFRGALGWLNVFILALLAGTLTGLMSNTGKLTNGAVVGGVTLVLLTIKAVTERTGRR